MTITRISTNGNVRLLGLVKTLRQDFTSGESGAKTAIRRHAESPIVQAAHDRQRACFGSRNALLCSYSRHSQVTGHSSHATIFRTRTRKRPGRREILARRSISPGAFVNTPAFYRASRAENEWTPKITTWW